MDVSKTAIMNLMGAQMAFQSQRHAQIASNISHIDQPEYQARDLRKFDFERLVGDQVGRLQLRATNAQHLPPHKPNTGDFRDGKLRNSFETTPMGNNITVDQQTALAAQNTAQYQLTTNLYRKYTQMYRTSTVGAR